MIKSLKLCIFLWVSTIATIYDMAANGLKMLSGNFVIHKFKNYILVILIFFSYRPFRLHANTHVVYKKYIWKMDTKFATCLLPTTATSKQNRNYPGGITFLRQAISALISNWASTMDPFGG